jgi:predicted Zn finger-like uncharacterized protein
MRIVCPSCSAAYDVPDSLVRAGRVVRCARCDGEWTPVEASAVPPEEVLAAPMDELATVPPEEEPPGPPPADPALPVPEAHVPETPANRIAAAPRQSAMDRLVAQSTRPQSSTHLRLAWVASLVLLVLAAGAAYTWRAQIIAAWPPSAHAYAALGLHPQTEAPQ